MWMLKVGKKVVCLEDNQANRADIERLQMEFLIWFPKGFSVPCTPLTRGLCTHTSFRGLITTRRKDFNTRFNTICLSNLPVIK